MRSVSFVHQFITAFLATTIQVAVTSVITVCRDPKDNRFLELAVDGQANYIVSGDNDLLALHPYQGISIVSPADFLVRWWIEEKPLPQRPSSEE